MEGTCFNKNNLKQRKTNKTKENYKANVYFLLERIIFKLPKIGNKLQKTEIQKTKQNLQNPIVSKKESSKYVLANL